jgi:hypothetical protein
MATQLRIYTINKGQLHAFAEEWARTIKPLRERLGFRVPAAWTCESTNQFFWVLEYHGPAPWQKLDRAYHESDERLAMQPDPGRLIARMEHFFLEPAG